MPETTADCQMVAAAGATAGQPVIRIPRFASDPFPWGHGPDLNDGLRFSDSEVRPAGDAR
ncbi:hypothetical protein [Streptomyces sp. NPDC005302]|uniref:hypothetical protein n=1 Tax=Streptomyces sp. NPDC005302 TaxID=3154675 RepID=UPI0033AF46FD